MKPKIKDSIKWAIGFMILCLMAMSMMFSIIGLYYLNYIMLCIMCFILGYAVRWSNETKNLYEKEVRE